MAKKKRNAQMEMVLDMLKEETAQEMGIEVGADTSSRLNGAVGGMMTKKLVALAEEILNQKS
jgi:small acid-soluble spore protein B (major beta-type SASP)